MQEEVQQQQQLTNKRKEEILEYLSFIEIPDDYLGGILKIWDYFQNYGNKYFGTNEFTPYELYIELVQNEQSDMIDTLASSVLSFIWEEIVKTQKKQVFTLNTKTGRQLSLKVPSLFLLRNSTENDIDRLEQQMYYIWYQIYQDLKLSQEIVEIPDLEHFTKHNQNDESTDGTEDDDSIQSEQDIEKYVSFMEKDMLEKIEILLDILSIATAAIPYEIQEIDKNVWDNIQYYRQKKSEEDGQVFTKRDLQSLIKNENQYYFNDRTSKMLGRSYKDNFSHVVFQKIPNFVFIFGKQGELRGYIEGYSQVQNILNDLDYSNRVDRELIKNLKSFENSQFFTTQVSLEEEKLISNEDKEKFYSDKKIQYKEKDFQKLINPYITTFVINRKKTNLSLDLIKDLVSSTAEIWHIHCSTMYQSRWGTKEERDELNDLIVNSDSVEKLCIYLQDMSQKLTEVKRVWHKECPNYKAFVPEMEFDELEKKDNLQEQKILNKINFWGGDKQSYRQIWTYLARQVELSQNIEELFLITIYFFDMVDDMITKKEKHLKQMRKNFQNLVHKATKQNLQEKVKSQKNKKEELKAMNTRSKSQGKKSVKYVEETDSEQDNSDEYSVQETESEDDDNESSEVSDNSESDNNSYKPTSKLKKKGHQKNQKNKQKKKKRKPVINNGLCEICKESEKGEVVQCIICDQYSHLSCNKSDSNSDKKQFTCEQCEEKKKNTKTRGQKKKYVQIQSDSEEGDNNQEII